MQNLDKKKKGSFFSFDLEKELQEDPAHAKKTLKKVEEKILKIKSHLRKGAEKKEFDQWSSLLHGYTALQKVLKKVSTKR